MYVKLLLCVKIIILFSEGVYSIQSNLSVTKAWQVGGFSPGSAVSFTNKTDYQETSEILLTSITYLACFLNIDQLLCKLKN